MPRHPRTPTRTHLLQPQNVELSCLHPRTVLRSPIKQTPRCLILPGKHTQRSNQRRSIQPISRLPTHHRHTKGTTPQRTHLPPRRPVAPQNIPRQNTTPGWTTTCHRRRTKKRKPLRNASSTTEHTHPLHTRKNTLPKLPNPSRLRTLP